MMQWTPSSEGECSGQHREGLLLLQERRGELCSIPVSALIPKFGMEPSPALSQPSNAPQH